MIQKVSSTGKYSNLLAALGFSEFIWQLIAIYASVIVLPCTKKSNRIIPFLSQKTEASRGDSYAGNVYNVSAIL